MVHRLIYFPQLKDYRFVTRGRVNSLSESLRFIRAVYVRYDKSMLKDLFLDPRSACFIFESWLRSRLDIVCSVSPSYYDIDDHSFSIVVTFNL